MIEYFSEPEMDMQVALVETANIFDFHLLLNIGGTHFRIRYSTIQVCNLHMNEYIFVMLKLHY